MLVGINRTEDGSMRIGESVKCIISPLREKHPRYGVKTKIAAGTMRYVKRAVQILHRTSMKETIRGNCI